MPNEKKCQPWTDPIPNKPFEMPCFPWADPIPNKPFEMPINLEKEEKFKPIGFLKNQLLKLIKGLIFLNKKM